MNNEEMSEIIQNLMSNMNFNSQNSEDTFENSNQDTLNNNSFNLDFDTIMKMKNIMDKINSNQNTPDTNLLMSLRPFLNENRKQKLDQYMQFLKLAKIIESLNSDGEVNNLWK